MAVIPSRRRSTAARRYNSRMTTLFISDLHLDPERPEVTRLFGEFIDGEARGATALYILGDLFEAWVGDDDPSELGVFVADRLRGLTDAGVPVHFQHGNRDFLVGRAFAHRAGIRAQAVLRDGTLVHDFLIERTPRSIHVLNAPSPAATSAMPIAEYLVEQLDSAK